MRIPKKFETIIYVKFLPQTQLNFLWSLFMDGVQLPQGYRATIRKQFTFYHEVPRYSWCSFEHLQIICVDLGATQ